MVPTLQKLCEVGVAIDICNDPEVKEIIFKTSKCFLEFSSLENYNNIKEFKIVEKYNNIEEFKSWYNSLLVEVSDLIKKFPSWMLGQVKDYIPIIAINMLKWARFHKETFLLSFEFSKSFFNNSLFTNKGEIDWEKASRALIEETSLRPSTLFRISCFYSLSDLMMKFWVQIPNFEILSVSSGDILDDVVILWTDLLLGRDKSNDFSYDAFKAASYCGNEISFRYFWKKLDEDAKRKGAKFFAQTLYDKLTLWRKKRQCVEIVYLFEPYIDIFKFLAEDLENEKLRALLNDYKLTYWVLTYMLHWPRPPLFIGMVNLMWEILKKSEFYRLLLDIIVKTDDPFVGKLYDYRVLLGEFWNASPQDMKKDLFRLKPDEREDPDPDLNSVFYCDGGIIYSYGYHIMVKLFGNDFTDIDKKNVFLILESFTQSELETIAKPSGLLICAELITKGNFSCADLFVKCCNVVDVNYYIRPIVKLPQFNSTIDKLVEECKFDIIDQTFEWILCSEDFIIFKQKLSTFMSVNFLTLNSNSIVDKYQVTIPSKYNINININVEPFVEWFKSWISLRKLNEANQLLKWLFNSEKEISDFKSTLIKRVTSDPEAYIQWDDVMELKNMEQKIKENALLFQSSS